MECQQGPVQDKFNANGPIKALNVKIAKQTAREVILLIREAVKNGTNIVE